MARTLSIQSTDRTRIAVTHTAGKRGGVVRFAWAGGAAEYYADDIHRPSSSASGLWLDVGAELYIDAAALGDVWTFVLGEEGELEAGDTAPAGLATTSASYTDAQFNDDGEQVSYYDVTSAPSGAVRRYGWNHYHDQLEDADGGLAADTPEAEAATYAIANEMAHQSYLLGREVARLALANATPATIERDAEVAFDHWLAEAHRAGDLTLAAALERANVLYWADGYEAVVRAELARIGEGDA
jgi:hypothetical protein